MKSLAILIGMAVAYLSTDTSGVDSAVALGMMLPTTIIVSVITYYILKAAK